jgi:hypothetical protein
MNHVRLLLPGSASSYYDLRDDAHSQYASGVAVVVFTLTIGTGCTVPSCK